MIISVEVKFLTDVFQASHRTVLFRESSCRARLVPNFLRRMGLQVPFPEVVLSAPAVNDRQAERFRFAVIASPRS